MSDKSMRNQKVVVCLVVMGMMIGLPGIAGAKETLVIGMQDDTVSLDPAQSYETSAWGIMSQFYERLVDFDQENVSRHVPELAESWEIGDDGKTWTFHLRKGVMFSTGNPVNAAAVVFSLRRVIALAGPPAWLLTQFGLAEESIREIDEYTVQLTLKQQYAPALVLSCLSSYAAGILDPVSLMGHEQDGDMGSAWLEDHSAGTGPYVLAERNREEPGYYILKANQDYWGNPPDFQEITIKRVQEPLEQMTFLESGELDVAWNLSPEQLATIADNPDFQIANTGTLAIVWIAMNLSYPPFENPNIRNAIRYAIDYDGIISYILQKAAQPIQTIIPKGMLGYNPSMPYYLDLNKAKQLLNENGYSDGFDLELASLNFSPWIDLARQVKEDLGKIGVTVTITPLTPDQLMEKMFSKSFQMFVWDWRPDYVDPDMNAKGFAHCDSLDDDATIKLVAWMANYLNKETSKLAEQAAQELDVETRSKLYRQLTDIILHDGPFAVLYSPFKQYAVRTEIIEFLGTPPLLVTGFPPLL